jgi:hypothetical protein
MLSYFHFLRLQGGRNHLQSGFAAHMRGVVSRHRSTAQRGADPDPLRDVQAYLAVKFRDKGLLDITAPGGVDTTWAQVGCCSAVGNCKGSLSFRWQRLCVAGVMYLGVIASGLVV